MTLERNDFLPLTSWKFEQRIRYHGGSPVYIRDGSTLKLYFNVSKIKIRFQCFLLLFGTPVAYSFTFVYDVAKKTAEIAFFKFLSYEKTIKGSLKKFSFELLQLMGTPFILTALEVSALYGILSPYNGRKLFASFERIRYEEGLIAPFFQPKPADHENELYLKVEDLASP